MQKTVLIAGKEVPLGAAVGAAARNTARNVIITNSAGARIQPPVQLPVEKTPQAPTLEELPWNRSSSIAARSLILRGECLFGAVQEAVLIFDTPFFAASYQDITALGCSQAIDSLMAGYLYLTCEILQHFKRSQNGTIAFIHRTATSDIPNIPVGMAEQAFVGLAEETSKSCRNLPWQTLLVRAGAENDEDIAQWLFPYISEMQKNQTKWIKPLSKPGLFGFL